MKNEASWQSETSVPLFTKWSQNEEATVLNLRYTQEACVSMRREICKCQHGALQQLTLLPAVSSHAVAEACMAPV